MDFAVAAERMSEVGRVCVESVGVEPGMKVLDVGCGTGNATIPAAQLGARVTGLDSSADLLAVARERAADAMVEVDWIVGDPTALPFEDGSFDRVISMFGGASTSELRRVCRGRIAICRWTDEGPLDRRRHELIVLDV
jgi:ubiquinone/menaquinone biosynthesis C-methylase UbiE